MFLESVQKRYVEDLKGQVSKTNIIGITKLYNFTHKFCMRSMECKEFGFSILCEIPYNHIFYLLERESDIF
jgi:hypothetical protein